MQAKYNWKGDKDSDVTANTGDYILRAEDIGPEVWWAVFYKDEQVASSNDTNKMSRSMRSGMMSAVHAMRRHEKQVV